MTNHTRRQTRSPRRAIERASSCAFESLEGRRLLKAPLDVPALLPPLPAAPGKQPVIERSNQMPAAGAHHGTDHLEVIAARHAAEEGMARVARHTRFSGLNASRPSSVLSLGSV